MSALQRTPLLLGESDAEIERRRRAAALGSDEERQAHFGSMRRHGRAREYFDNALANVNQALDRRNKAWEQAREVYRQRGMDHPDAHGVRDAHQKAADDWRDSERELARQAHSVDHPVGQYVAPERERGKNHLERLARVAAPKGVDPKWYVQSKWQGGMSHSLSIPKESSPEVDRYIRHLTHALDSHGYKYDVKRDSGWIDVDTD